MAARINKIQHDPRTREKIRTSQLLNRLHAYALDEDCPQAKRKMELSSNQVRAMEILLRKSLPDLTAVQGTVTNVNVDASKLSDDELASYISGPDQEEGSPGIDEAEIVPRKPDRVY